MKKALGELACRCGLHAWEKDPSEKDLVRGTGVHMAMWSMGIQKGVRNCTRLSCTCRQKVYREGMVGAGVKEPKWKPMSARVEDRIDSLPNVFQS